MKNRSRFLSLINACARAFFWEGRAENLLLVQMLLHATVNYSLQPADLWSIVQYRVQLISSF